jgi:formate dehydrogenase subunit gamma
VRSTPKSAVGFDADLARQVIAKRAHLEGALLPILHGLQETFGWVPDAAVPLVADALNLSRAEVHGVLTFYHDFRRGPPGRHVLKVCRAEACQAMGADALAAHAGARLGVDFPGTTTDGSLSLDPVYCLGNCAAAPAIMLDGEVVGRMTPERLDRLVADADGVP